MLSSAGLHSPQLRSPLYLAAVALAALAVSLLLAFAVAPASRPDANGDRARHTIAERRSSKQTQETTAETLLATRAQPPAVSTVAGVDAEHGNDVGGAAGNGPSRRLLWGLLAPWAFAVDEIAVLGLAAVLIVRYNARRRRGARM